MFPKTDVLAKELTVSPIGKCNASEKLALTVLQGLVNQEAPQIYLVQEIAKDDPQYQFLQIIQEQGVKWKSYENPWQLFSVFKEKVAGLVVYDPKILASVDIALALASKENLIPVTTEIAQTLNEQFQFPVKDDLQGRWGSELAAHTWAYTELWPKFRRDLFVFLMYAGEVRIPHKLPLTSWSPYPYEAADYLVQHEIFPYTMLIKTIEGDFRKSIPELREAVTEEEIAICEQYLADLPPNTPALTGFNIPFGEHHGVGLLSAHGIFSLPIPGPNLSVHAATNFKPSVPFKQTARRKKDEEVLKKDKVYLTFILSDGDNLGTYPTKMAQWDDPKRGEVPIAWCAAPLAGELMPCVTRYFYETASENDYHVASCSGIGYTKPIRYGERLGEIRDNVYRDYLQLTAEYMEKMDLEESWPINTDSSIRKLYAEATPGLGGLFADFTPAATYEESIEVYGEVPAIRCLVGPWGYEIPGDEGFLHASWIAEEIIKKTPKERPAFMFIGLNGWSSGPGQLVEIMSRLGDEYVAVRPDQIIRAILAARK